MKSRLIKRVLMSTDTVGGVWTYSLDLAAAFRLFDVQVELVTVGPLPSADQRRAAEKIPNVTLHSIGGKLEWMSEPWDDVDRAGDFLVSLARDLSVDVVHPNTFSHGSLEFGRPVVVVAHSCVLSWIEAVRRTSAGTAREDGGDWAKYRGRVTLGLHSADAIVTPTKAFADEISRIYNPGKIRVIHNGRSGEGFGGEQAKKKHPLIMSAGRLWDEAKNISLLTGIASGLEWPTEIAGHTRHPDTHTEVEAPPGVTLLGHLSHPELARKLGQAAIYVAPARYEPFGLSILEAAMSACALVVSDIPTLREVWADAALYVNRDDPKGLTEAIQSLIASPAKLKEMSGRALARSRRYRPGAMAKAYLRTYEAALRCMQTPDDEQEPNNPLPIPA